MAKSKVKLSDDQKRKNKEILARLEEERELLIEETRSLQQGSRRRPGRKKQKSTP
jgi:hypothetical protein